MFMASARPPFPALYLLCQADFRPVAGRTAPPMHPCRAGSLCRLSRGITPAPASQPACPACWFCYTLTGLCQFFTWIGNICAFHAPPPPHTHTRDMELVFQLLISVFLSPEDSGLGHEQPGGRTPGRNPRVSRCQGTLQPRHRLVQDFPAGQRVWEAAALGAPERAVTSGTPTRRSRALDLPSKANTWRRRSSHTLLCVRPHSPPNPPTAPASAVGVEVRPRHPAWRLLSSTGSHSSPPASPGLQKYTLASLGGTGTASATSWD